MNKDRKLVTIYEAANEMEAQVIKGLLESFGVPCLLKPNTALPSPYSPVMNLGVIEIIVWDSMAEEARKLIEGNDNV
ncbi:putative signal transducing protein [Chloroflexota bacterium]